MCHLQLCSFHLQQWKNPETLAIISKIAGVDLVPVMDYEIGHVNIPFRSEAGPFEFHRSIAENMSHSVDEDDTTHPWKDDKPTVDWHTDSYPFVCVTMLSDCKNMIGGKTALRTGDSGVLKIRGPGMVRSDRPE